MKEPPKLIDCDDESSSESSGEEDIDSEQEAHDIKVQECSVAGRDAKNRPYYDKYAICFVCNNDFSALPKHLEARHADNDDVKELMSLPKGSKMRKDLLQKLSRSGNYVHNIKVLKEKKGELLPVRRPAVGKAVSYRQYTPCLYCKGFFLAVDLWRHAKICSNQENDKIQPKHLNSERSHKKASRAFLFASLHDKSFGLILPIVAKMRKRELAEIISNDDLMCRYGQFLCTMHATNTDQSRYIGNKLRELARLLLYLKEEFQNDNLKLADLLTADHFETIVQAVKKMPHEGPSTAKRIGESLGKVIVIYKGYLMTSGDRKQRKDADCFEWKLLNMWQDLVSVPAMRALHMAKQSKPCSLPFTSDVKLFCEKLESLLGPTLENVMNGNLAEGRLLSELCLAKIITLNKRR